MAIETYFQELDTFFADETETESQGEVNREVVISAILEAGYTQEQADEYVNEGEHQDGASFWTMFDTVEDVLFDVDLYFNHR